MGNIVNLTEVTATLKNKCTNPTARKFNFWMKPEAQCIKCITFSMRGKESRKGALGHLLAVTTLPRSDGMEMLPDRCWSNLFTQIFLLGDFTIPPAYLSLTDFS